MQNTEQLEVARTKLKVRFATLLTTRELGISPATKAPACWEFIKNQYSKEWRRYHTFFHLDRMFKEFDKVRDKLEHPDLVEFAIFLHDIIYVIGRKDNELKSAHVAKHWLQCMGADALTTRRVVRLITVGTKHPKSWEPRLTNDQKYMSDFDLYGFSLSWDTVLGQSRDVRREFSKFSDEEFRRGNGEFFMRMIQKRIYLTPYYAQYEQYARDNILMLLKNMDQVVMARPTDKRL